MLFPSFWLLGRLCTSRTQEFPFGRAATKISNTTMKTPKLPSNMKAPVIGHWLWCTANSRTEELTSATFQQSHYKSSKPTCWYKVSRELWRMLSLICLWRRSRGCYPLFLHSDSEPVSSGTSSRDSPKSYLLASTSHLQPSMKLSKHKG